MPLILTEEQTMLQEAADGFLADNAPIAHLRKLRDDRDPDGVSRDLWRAFGEMGFAGVVIPEAQGGLGLGAVEAGVIAESLGRTLTPSPFMGSSVLAATVLLQIVMPDPVHRRISDRWIDFSHIFAGKGQRL